MLKKIAGILKTVKKISMTDGNGNALPDGFIQALQDIEKKIRRKTTCKVVALSFNLMKQHYLLK